jgi:hypothetical protein
MKENATRLRETLGVPYHPAKNTTFSLVAETFGGSLGGSALVFVVERFIVDALVDPQEEGAASVTPLELEAGSS